MILLRGKSKMSVDDIRAAVKTAAAEFPITRAVLFGSMANGTSTAGSDVDLIMEFSAPVTLITLGLIKERMEEILKKSVDIIHGPLREDDMIEPDKEIEVYAA